MRRSTIGVDFAIWVAAEQLANAARAEDERFKVATATRSLEADASSSTTIDDYDCIPGPESGILRFSSETVAAAAAGIANHCSTSQCSIGSLGLSF